MIRPNADPNSVLERQALERRLAGVRRAYAAAQANGNHVAMQRHERLIAAMSTCLESGVRFYSLHRHRQPAKDRDS